MRVAALYDVHANLPALEAVLADVAQADIDLIVFGGDILPGPMPRETLARLSETSVPTKFVRGNGDRETLSAMRGEELATVPEPFRHIIHWTARQIDPEWEPVLSAWPDVLRIDIPGPGATLFCHATPRSDTEVFTRLTPEDSLVPLFDESCADLVVCGHTHMQFDRMVGRTRVVNAGSVGMPYGEPGACWLLLGPDIELRRTSYDLRAAADRVRRSAYPEAREFAEQFLLHPPAEVDMLSLFSRAALG